MNIKVLGSGCSKCHALEARTTDALRAAGLEASIDKVTDFGEIASYGVMSTPALVVDDRVVVSGRIPEVAELTRILAGATT